MDRTTSRELQHIGLPTACAEVYAAITGAVPDATEPTQMQMILNEVARALAYVVRIYSGDGFGVPQTLGGFDAGRFIRGAHAFQTSSGREIVGLTVQRRDMMRAIEVLRSAKIRFRAPSTA